jgi:hypothetical protein|nr:MAG TPA: Rad50 zinc hook motif [Caudoviricetes sp.]
MKLTKKQKNCPYCHPDKFNCTKPICDDLKNKLYVFPNGAIEMDYDDDDRPGAYFSESGLLDYCPKCRRPLNEEEK